MQCHILHRFAHPEVIIVVRQLAYSGVMVVFSPKCYCLVLQFLFFSDTRCELQIGQVEGGLASERLGGFIGFIIGELFVGFVAIEDFLGGIQIFVVLVIFYRGVGDIGLI